MKFKDLTKKELKHLRQVAGVTTLTAAKRTFELQAKMRAEADAEGMPPGIGEPCFECLAIARKLGIRE